MSDQYSPEYKINRIVDAFLRFRSELDKYSPSPIDEVVISQHFFHALCGIANSRNMQNIYNPYSYPIGDVNGDSVKICGTKFVVKGG